MSLITVIGRGHSGTRAMSHTLYASGVYMGKTLNASGDLVPPQDMYDACRLLARHVRWLGDLEWHFDDLHTMPIEPEFVQLVERYLGSVLENKAAHKGWKIPETTLVYPWIIRMFPEIKYIFWKHTYDPGINQGGLRIIRMFPEIKYIFWIRNPRDCILERHLTDDLQRFGIEYPPTEDDRYRRAISWKYQYDLVKATPKPQHWLEVRFEDFVLNQEETLSKLEDFLGMKLARIIVRPEAVDRWRQDDGVNYFDFLSPAMREYGYEIP